MPATYFTGNDIKQLYFECKRLSDDFSNLNNSLLAENPKLLVLFRSMLGLSQIEFAKLFGIDDANLSKYELGKIKKMQIKTAEKYMAAILRRRKHFPSLEVTLENFEKARRESQGWFAANTDNAKALVARRLGAANLLAKRLTEQESFVSELLTKASIKFASNYYLDKQSGRVVDFWLPEKKFVIECKKLVTKNRREMRDQIEKLALQGYKIKFKHRVKLLALIETKLPLWPRELQELNWPYDMVFTEPRKLVNFLRA